MARCCGKTGELGVRFWGICTFVCFALAVLWLLLGIWMTHLNERFTPVYTPITCRMGGARVTGLHGGLLTGLSLGLTMNTTCDNPNPYSLTLQSPQALNVYLGQSRDHVATITDIPRTTLPSKGSGVVVANADIKLSLAQLMQTLPLLTASQIPIYMDQQIHLEVDVNLLFTRWRTNVEFSKECGFNMQGLGSTLGDMITDQYEGSLGPMACADDFSSLTLPNVGEHGSRELRMFAVNVAPREVEEGERLKTTALSAAQGVFYALSGLLFVAVAFCLWGLLRERRQLAKKPAGAAEGAQQDTELAHNRAATELEVL